MEYQNEENPVTGGLAAVSDAPVRPVMRAPVEAPVDPIQAALKKVEAKREEVLEQQRKLLMNLEMRVNQPADALGALSAGLLAPNRSGHFGEAFGNAMQNMNAYRNDNSKRAEELAKMRFELGKAELEQTKQDVLTQGVMGLTSGQPAGQPTGQGGGPAGLVTPAMRPLLQMMAAMDPQSALKYLGEVAKDDAKRPDAIKALETYLQMLPPEQRAAARSYIAQANIFGKPEDKTQAVAKIYEGIDSGYIPRDQGMRMIAQLQAGQAPTVSDAPAAPPVAASPVSPTQPVAPVTSAAPPAPPSVTSRLVGDPAQVRDEISRIQNPAERSEVGQAYERQIAAAPIQSAPQAAPPTKMEREVTQAGAVEREREQAKLDIARREALQQAAEKARRTITDSNAVFDLASKNPNAFGVLAKPGIANALLTLVENGVRVGVYSVGINDIQSAILKAGGTQKDIDAVAALAQIAVQTSLDLSAAVKGSVSNYEQQLFQQASFTKADSPAVLKYKAELARARGEFDKFLWQQYRSYEKSNKGKSVEDFKDSPDYARYVEQYENTLKGIRSHYFR